MKLSVYVGLFLSVLANFAFVVPAQADQNDPRLDGLFTSLNRLEPVPESKFQVAALQSAIWKIWAETNNLDASEMFEAGDEAIQRGKLDVAVEFFGKAIEADETFSEAWNRRATLYFLTGRMEESLADVEKVIELEPRHFGALAGAGQIYLKLDRREDARQAFRRALAVNPHMKSVRGYLDTLQKELDGQAI